MIKFHQCKKCGVKYIQGYKACPACGWPHGAKSFSDLKNHNQVQVAPGHVSQRSATES